MEDFIKGLFLGIFGTVSALIAALFTSFFGAWILMLFAGGWASEWFGISGVAYWQALVTVFILRALVLQYSGSDD